jgi:putative membrane protein
MRTLCFLFLVAFAGAVGIFAYQNQEEMTIAFLQWSITASLPMVAGIIYVLGMLSGWTIVGLVRRSVNRVVAAPR